MNNALLQFEQIFNFKYTVLRLALGAVILSTLFILSNYSFLLFHVIAEFYSIIIGISLFLFTKNTRKLAKNDFFYFLGIVYLFISCLDVAHTLTYKGMGIFHFDDSNIPTQIWIAARYMEAVSFLISAFLINRKINSSIVFVLYSITSLVVMLSILWLKIFPDCFIEGKGLTPFKIYSEYLICVIMLLNFILFHKQRNKIPFIFIIINISIIFTLLSELTFTFYTSVYGLSNVFGHFLKFVSFYFIYKMVVYNGIDSPFNLLSNALKQKEDAIKLSNEKLSQLNSSLEIKVKEEVEKNSKKEKLLIQQSRFAQMGELLNMIAHQWRQPLNAISTATIGLRLSETLGENDKDKNNEALSFIEGQTIKMSDIINDFMNFFTPQKEKHEIDFNSIFKNVLQIIGSLLEVNKIKVEINCTSKNIFLGFGKELEQIMLNLFANSKDAFLEGSVTLKTICIDIIEEDNNVKIIFTDNAGGINPEIIDRIFDPYFTTKEKGKGTGIGLYMSKMIIEKSFNGSIQVENIEGGAKFTMLLPK